MDCIFCKIANGEVGTQIYQDPQVVAFNDNAPQAPIHVLIIPRHHIATVNELTESDNALVGHMIQVAKNIAKEKNIDESGYRLLLNCNRGGGQAVYHLHLHLLGGRPMHWPPG